MKKIFYSAIIILLSFTGFSQPGTLDKTFGDNGMVKTYIGQNTDLKALTIQRDGKIIAFCGRNIMESFTLARYNADGSIDKSFGNSGIANTELNGRTWSSAVLMQVDGKIIAVGTVFTHDGFYEVVLLRYQPNGSIDASFGENGIARARIKEINHAFAAAIQTDGKILVTGRCADGYFPRGAPILTLRYDTNGTLDSTFGKSGVVFTDFEAGNNGIGYAIRLQSDGKIVIAGHAEGSPAYAVIVRLEANGNVDSSFGTNGKIKSTLVYFAYDVIIQEDGKIVIGGGRIVSNKRIPALARYTSNGSVDSSFGQFGLVNPEPATEKLSSANVYSMDQQSDGDFVCSIGATVESYGYIQHVLRFSKDGEKDKRFGRNGRVYRYARLSQSGFPPFLPLTVQSDDKIVAGTNYDDDLFFSSILLYRLLGDDANMRFTDKKTLEDLKSITIYPNPVSESLFIKNLDNAHSSFITITDISGNVIKKQKLSSGQSFIDVSGLKKGNYILEVQQSNKRGSVQFMKQ